MSAIEFNRHRRQRGQFSDVDLEQLVRYFQWSRGMRGNDFDGKFGNDSEIELDRALKELAIPWAGEITSPGADTAPIVTSPFAGWVYPMPPFIDKEGRWGDVGQVFLPRVTSGYSKYGSGPNTDRENHWGVDVMYKKVSTGKHLEPTEDKYGNFCPAGISVLSIGPGTVWSVNRGNVLIDHHNVPGFGPLTSWYQHMNEALVEKGDQVVAGDPIGICGTVYTNLRHLHFEFRDHNRGGSRAASVVNPEPFIRNFPVHHVT